MRVFFAGEATVTENIEPGKKGRVRFRASYWYAVCEEKITLSAGTLVQVRGNENITLIVEPI
ncbi:MAG: NfeD family protein [Oscillatoria sp. PMC 1068.18]|nr:NfeD family protein [Oscillatoria sp. PMC 1076.18]MEC4989525.1 NfeD family protein [Oscillatoria sp. PMC 1068.18]